MPNALRICKSLDIRCFFKPWPLWRVWIFSTDGVERLSIDESADNIFVGIYSSVAEEGPPTSKGVRLVGLQQNLNPRIGCRLFALTGHFLFRPD